MHQKNYKLSISNRDINIEMQYAFKKRLTLSIYPDKRVVARIPYGMSKKTVENYFLRKSKWILKHLDHFDQHPPEEELQYQEGESLKLLGKEFTLNIKQGRSRVEVIDQNIILYVSEPDDKDLKEKVILKWYRKQAIEIMTPLFDKWMKQLSYLKLPKTTLRFYKMKRRWGSCSSKGTITLNTELIKKDLALIDYVIVHEICHLKVPAHNKAFYSLVESIMPNWKERRTFLR